MSSPSPATPGPAGPAGPAPAGAPAQPAGTPAILSVLLLATTLTVMAGAIVMPVVEVIRGDLGISGTEAGLILTAHGLSLAVASPLTGWLVDRMGVRTPLAAGLVLYGLAGGAGLLTDSYVSLLLTRIVFGIGAAFVFTGTTVAVLALYQGPERDRVMGWRATAQSLGGVVWPLIGGALGGVSWHAPFAIYLLGVPLGLATLAALPDTRGAGGPAKGGTVLQLLRQRPALIGFYLLQAVCSVLLYAIGVFLPQRLAELGVEEPFLVALYNVVMTVVMSLVGLVYAKLRAGLGYTLLLRLAAVAWVAAFLILGVADQTLLLFLAPALFGLGLGMAFPALAVLIGEGAPPELRGQATSLSGTATFIGQFASPLLLGPLIGATSVTTGFLASAGLSAVVLLLLLPFRAGGPAAAPGGAAAADAAPAGAAPAAAAAADA
ncbi:MFS transporter [Streptomyces sp. NPDC101118]|uniref:MFS transporter n=1 Tax=Streptomyces sp. NPDC101118 TaxID=3366109 RepID=UPI003802AFF1